MPANKFVNLQPIFSDALEHHRLGRLQDAEQRYREILTVEPQHTDALCGLSMLAHQTGRNDVAIELASTAIRLKP